MIGGDGSLRGALALHELGVPVMSASRPASTMTSGAPIPASASTQRLNTILDAVDRLRDTATSHNRAFVVEVMGRDCGYLAVMAGILGGAEIVVTPENGVTMNEIASSLEDAYIRGKTHAIAVLAEGAPYQGPELARLPGAEAYRIRDPLTILGHTQRGGSPTAFDRLLATRMGVYAVELLLSGHSGVMVARVGREQVPMPLKDCTSKTRQITPEYFDLARILSR